MQKQLTDTQKNKKQSKIKMKQKQTKKPLSYADDTFKMRLQ